MEARVLAGIGADALLRSEEICVKRVSAFLRFLMSFVTWSCSSLVFADNCPNGCLNGGRCVGRNQCLCPQSVTGVRCETGQKNGDHVFYFVCFTVAFLVR